MGRLDGERSGRIRGFGLRGDKTLVEGSGIWYGVLEFGGQETEKGKGNGSRQKSF